MTTEFVSKTSKVGEERFENIISWFHDLFNIKFNNPVGLVDVSLHSDEDENWAGVIILEDGTLLTVWYVPNTIGKITIGKKDYYYNPLSEKVTVIG